MSEYIVMFRADSGKSFEELLEPLKPLLAKHKGKILQKGDDEFRHAILVEFPSRVYTELWDISYVFVVNPNPNGHRWIKKI